MHFSLQSGGGRGHHSSGASSIWRNIALINTMSTHNEGIDSSACPVSYGARWVLAHPLPVDQTLLPLKDFPELQSIFPYGLKMLQLCLESILGCSCVWKTFTRLSASSRLLVPKTRPSQAARTRQHRKWLSGTEVRQENGADLICVPQSYLSFNL